jgi:flagellar biosynthesis/type III secretory pathway protein FliH
LIRSSAVILRRKYVASVDVDEKAYEKGYMLGSNSGYGQGRRDGIKEGYERGFREGYKKGWGIGYKKGHKTAREKILTSSKKLSQ